MPIKFRCTHCRQFLGIARSQAGAAVDCPSCGRTLRVPQSDGRVEPLPQPVLNLKDASLVEALDELALIGQEPIGDSEPAPPSAEPAPAVRHAPLLAPAPEPISLAPALPAQPVAEPKSPPRENELAVLAQSHPGSRPSASSARLTRAKGKRNRSSLLSLPAVLAVCITAVVAFGLGYAIGKGGAAGDVALPEPSQRADENPAAEQAEDRRSPPALPPALKGRITYRTKGGSSRPDRGARVLVFPQSRPGETKLPVVGLRGGDSPDDFRVARAGIRELGGDVAIVDDQGHFEIRLPAVGTYHILVVSRFQPRETEEPIESALKALLEEWFLRPEQLLGQVRYHFGQVRSQGAGTDIWDHSFGVEG